MKIGFFDSGLGGLTVLKEALDSKKINEEIYYLADNLNTPYGIKEKEYVRKIIDENISYLVSVGCNPIVIACNTATSIAIMDLREKFKNIEIIGTEPAVKVAVDKKLNKKVFVFATTITVNEEKLHHLINDLDATSQVELIAADKLVTIAEDVDCSLKNQEIEEYLYSILKKYDLTEFSHIVLGCTHFPLFRDNFKNVIERINSNASIELIDGAKGIINNLIKKIDNIKEKSDDKLIHVILTKESDIFKKRVYEILENLEVNFEFKLQ